MLKRRDKAGVSLAELLIAIAVIVVGMSGVAASLYFGFTKSKHGDEVADGTQYARMLIDFTSKLDLANAFPLDSNNLPKSDTGINDSTGQAPRKIDDPPFSADQFWGLWSTSTAEDANDKSHARLGRFTRNIRIERIGKKGTPEEHLGRITVTIYWPKEKNGGKNYVVTSTLVGLSKGAP